jgi:uncharacterized Zn-finger protein
MQLETDVDTKPDTSTEGESVYPVDIKGNNLADEKSHSGTIKVQNLPKSEVESQKSLLIASKHWSSIQCFKSKTLSALPQELDTQCSTSQTQLETIEGSRYNCTHDAGRKPNMGIVADKNKQKFLCEICGRSYKYVCHLKEHSKTHTGKRDYKCSLCEKSYFRHRDLEEHEKIHYGTEYYHCNICNKAFVRRSGLNRHKKVHTENALIKCGHCDKYFIQKSHLDEHVLTHLGVKPFKCEDCGTSFVRRRDMRRHFERKHQNMK